MLKFSRFPNLASYLSFHHIPWQPTCSHVSRLLPSPGNSSLLRLLSSQHNTSKRKHSMQDTKKGMLLSRPLEHIPHSKICWFTDLCKSQCLKQFAAPFIVIRIKASIADTKFAQMCIMHAVPWQRCMLIQLHQGHLHTTFSTQRLP